MVKSEGCVRGEGRRIGRGPAAASPFALRNLFALRPSPFALRKLFTLRHSLFALHLLLTPHLSLLAQNASERLRQQRDSLARIRAERHDLHQRTRERPAPAPGPPEPS